MDDAISEVEFLVRSDARVGILVELADGDRSRDRLKSAIDADRTTITRNLDALRESGWIAEEERTYALEPHREPVVRDLLSFIDSVRLTDRLQQFFEWIDLSQLDFEVDRLRDAEIWTAQPGDPWAMVNRHVASLGEMDEARVLLPVTGLSAKNALRDRVVESGARADMIVSPDVIETYRSKPEYADLYRSLRESDRASYRVYDGDIPFYLGVLDDRTVQIGVSEGDEPRALVESEDAAVREWAHRTLDEYESEAKPVPEE